MTFCKPLKLVNRSQRKQKESLIDRSYRFRPWFVITIIQGSKFIDTPCMVAFQSMSVSKNDWIVCLTHKTIDYEKHINKGRVWEKSEVSGYLKRKLIKTYITLHYMFLFIILFIYNHLFFLWPQKKISQGYVSDL